MKTITCLALLIALLIVTTATQAQNLIAVQNSNTPSFYTSLDSAIVHAVNGDTIYIPGGNFALNTNISKRLHIIGVGHNPDSTLVTNPTNITNSVTLITGASGGSLMGVKFGDLMFGTYSGNGNVNNFTIGRCFFGTINGIGTNSPSNNIFYENIMTHIYLSNSQSNSFFNNVISGWIYLGTSNIIKNNIFIYYGGGNILQINTYSNFENNIFLRPSTGSTTFSANSQYNTFNNNLFIDNISFPFNNNTGINNIVNQTETSIWVNKSGTIFTYTQDYHLQPTCPGKNAGRDGTDVGIYGGLYPWKAGSIPSNPHIQTMKIAPQTDANGSLNVNIKVKAQEN